MVTSRSSGFRCHKYSYGFFWASRFILVHVSDDKLCKLNIASIIRWHKLTLMNDAVQRSDCHANMRDSSFVINALYPSAGHLPVITINCCYLQYHGLCWRIVPGLVPRCYGKNIAQSVVFKIWLWSGLVFSFSSTNMFLCKWKSFILLTPLEKCLYIFLTETTNAYQFHRHFPTYMHIYVSSDTFRLIGGYAWNVILEGAPAPVWNLLKREKISATAGNHTRNFVYESVA
jgi:hypothetical protein